ncbi:prolactin-releasing peptide receptor-like [Actinia tenebrosa]|uniref:Prolactin-releasing peptide receptor-like n=1 Tax=Actinia tenebrosa TaxID=6105 RepID=A0A6P8HHB9_ACTTE|nr:prolactin-releasing peptide receptor-like [Actinia tenebrosa]
MLFNVSNVFRPLETMDKNGTFPETSDEALSKKIAKTTAYVLLFLISVAGNSFIVWVIHRDKRLRNTTNILVANMAVSDLLVPVFTIQGEVLDMYCLYTSKPLNNDFGLGLCKLVHFFQEVSVVVSIYSCIFIAIDRYFAVVYPLKRGFSKTRLKYIIPGIWIFALMMGAPNLYKYRIVNGKGHKICQEDWSPAGVPHMEAMRIQMFILFSLLNGLPIPFITVLYVLICIKLRNQKGPGVVGDAARARRQRQNNKVLKLSIVIVCLLFFSWLFLDIVLFLGLLGELDSLPVITAANIVFAARFIAYSSSSYNIFVYLIFTKNYREHLKILVSLVCCKGSANSLPISSSDQKRVGQSPEHH